MKASRRSARAVLFAASAALSLALSPNAFAGGSGLDGFDEDEDRGSPFFGEVKDIKSGKSVEDARVVAELSSGGASLVTRSDAEGRYRIAGFGKDINPDDVIISCTKEGYKSIDTIRNRLSNDPNAPIEVDCLIEKQ